MRIEHLPEEVFFNAIVALPMGLQRFTGCSHSHVNVQSLVTFPRYLVYHHLFFLFVFYILAPMLLFSLLSILLTNGYKMMENNKKKHAAEFKILVKEMIIIDKASFKKIFACIHNYFK